MINTNLWEVAMKEEKAENSIIQRIGNIYQLSAIKRSVIIWLVFQCILWLAFGISYIINKDAWSNVIEVESAAAAVGGWWSTFLFIIVSNLFICILIILGNVFVRFNIITPGLIILVVQGIMIGWLAGSNGFEIPFASVKAANLQYLRIGIWETTAYALTCAVTLPKSLLIADTFPAKKWSQIRKFKDIKTSITETIILFLCVVLLIAAAIIETFAIIG
jgi:hypothetical protein